MKRVVMLSLLAAVVTVTQSKGVAQSQAASSEDEQSTTVVIGKSEYACSNGRTWKKLDFQSRVMFLNGFEEGMWLLLQETAGKRRLEVTRELQSSSQSLMVRGFRFADLVKQVDEVYTDSANIRIPVIEAYRYVLMKLRGTSRQQLEDTIAGLRRKYNN